MKKTFNTYEYVKDLGEDLIREFEKSGKTTHPHSIGEGREKSVINKINDILPDGVGIGSGFVIDYFGNVSSQCDIIIYEKNLCLKFNNNDSKNRYYNCESVIAVGEVKSDLRKKELKDSIEKMKKIKKLKRYITKEKVFRKYLSTQGLIGTEEEKIDQKNNEMDQIFTFLICNSFKIGTDKIIETIKSSTYEKYEYINCIISVDGKYIGYAKKSSFDNYNKQLSAINSDSIILSVQDSSFGKLMELIFFVINNGRSVEYNPSIYISKRKDFKSKIFPI